LIFRKPAEIHTVRRVCVQESIWAGRLAWHFIGKQVDDTYPGSFEVRCPGGQTERTAFSRYQSVVFSKACRC
jgi:hypothetical protein